MTVGMNVLEQITDSMPPHHSGPLSFPFGMSSLNFESMCPFCFTPTWPTPFVLSFRKPPRWHYTALPLSWPSIAKEKVNSKKGCRRLKKTFIHEVKPFQCLLVFFDNFHFNCLLILTSSQWCVGQSWGQGEPCSC